MNDVVDEGAGGAGLLRVQSVLPFGSRAVAGGRVAVGSGRFEVSLARICGVFGLLFVLQTGQAFAVDLPSTPGLLGVATGSLVIASVLCGLGASVLPRFSRPFLFGAIALYVIASVLWLLSIRHPIPAAPFPYFPAVAVASLAYFAVACNKFLVCMFGGAVLSAYLGVGLVLAGGLSPEAALSDALFLVAMSIGLPLLVTAVRRGVRRADEAQSVGLASYARTTADDATEAERRRTDALLHDAVLTTYLAAASARTVEEEQLAARMAANARSVLAHLGRAADRGPVVLFDQAYAAMGAELEPLLSEFIVHIDAAYVVLPSEVADAMLHAMLQAMTNSVQHARAQEREIRMSPLGPDGLRITVRDDGVGFDSRRRSIAQAPMRVSVVDRMQRVDGRAEIRSSPGRGCLVVLSWSSVAISGVDPLQDLLVIA